MNKFVLEIVFIEPLYACDLEGRKEMFYLTTQSTHFNMVIWCKTYGKEPFNACDLIKYSNYINSIFLSYVVYICTIMIESLNKSEHYSCE